MSEENWIKQQRKAFTGWCNQHLKKRNLKIEYFEDDLPSGVILWNLMEIISGKNLPKLESKTPKTQIQMLGNLQITFKFLEQQKLKLVNIAPGDIYDRNGKLMLGFIWTLILRYQLAQSAPEQSADNGEAKSNVHQPTTTNVKKDMIDWVNTCIEGIQVTDFKTSWQNGKAFCGLVNNFKPGAVTPIGDPIKDMTNAFNVAEREFQIPQLLEPELVASDPDELSIMTYVSYFRVQSFKEPSQTSTTKQNTVNDIPDETSTIDFDDTKPAANLTTYLKITAKNSNNPIRPQSGLALNLDIQGPEQPTTQVTDHGNGTYTVKLVLPVVGIYSCAASFGEHKVQPHPLQIPARVLCDSDKTCAYGRGLKKATINEEARFFIKTRNASGERIRSGGERFKISVSVSGKNIPVQIEDQNNGVYYVKYKPTDVGNHLISVSVSGGLPIQGSPFLADVTTSSADPSNADPEKCWITGYGSKHAAVSVPAHFSIHTKNAAGDIPAHPNEDFEIYSTSQPLVDFEVANRFDGSYEVTYIPQTTGNMDINILLEGITLKGSPLDVTVHQDAVPNPGRCIARGDGLKDPVIGESSRFFIELRDGKGNMVTSDYQDQLKIQLIAPNNSPVLIEDISRDQSGAYIASYIPADESYQIHVSLDGENIHGSPFSVKTRPATDASKCTLYGPGLGNQVQLSKPSLFYVQSRDAQGSPISWGGNKYDVRIEGTNDIEIKDNYDGTHTITYHPETPGTYKIYVSLRGKLLTGCPYVVEIQDYDMLERLRKEEEDRLNKEALEKQKQKEEEERRKREEEERKRKEEELKQQEEERRQREEEERKRKEELKQQEEERKKREEADRLRLLQEEEERKRQEAEEAERIRLLKEEEERRIQEEEEALRLLEEQERLAQEERNRKAEEERKRKEKEEEEEERRRREEEEEEEAARILLARKKEEEERKRREEEARKEREQEELERKRKEEERLKQEAEEKERLRVLEEERLRKEAEESRRLKDEAARNKREAEERKRKEEEERKRKEEEDKKRKEDEDKKRKEEERRRKKEEEERKKKEDEERRKLADEERKKKKKEEDERKKKEDEERKKKDEEERKRREEERRKKREEDERKRKEEEERRKKELAERIKKAKEERPSITGVQKPPVKKVEKKEVKSRVFDGLNVSPAKRSPDTKAKVNNPPKGSKHEDKPPPKVRKPEEKYTPVKDDPVDAELAKFLNNVKGNLLLPSDFKRVAPGVYMWNKARISLRFINGNIIVRVGGGWSALSSFLERYANETTSKMTEAEKMNLGEGGWSHLDIEKKRRSKEDKEVATQPTPTVVAEPEPTNPSNGKEEAEPEEF